MNYIIIESALIVFLTLLMIYFMNAESLYDALAKGGNIMKMSNETYDIWKKICQYWIPALGTLYFTVAQIVGLPYGEQVVGVLTAIDTFLGVVLGISTHQYNKGDKA